MTKVIIDGIEYALVKSNAVAQAWAERCKLHAEGDKLYAEGDKLRAEGSKVWAEGDKLRAEGDMLRAEGDIIFLSAVIYTYGEIKLEWKNWTDKGYECHLENGEVYKPE